MPQRNYRGPGLHPHFIIFTFILVSSYAWISPPQLVVFSVIDQCLLLPFLRQFTALLSWAVTVHLVVHACIICFVVPASATYGYWYCMSTTRRRDGSNIMVRGRRTDLGCCSSDSGRICKSICPIHLIMSHTVHPRRLDPDVACLPLTHADAPLLLLQMRWCCAYHRYCLLDVSSQRG